jgi:hypothetical protein
VRATTTYEWRLEQLERREKERQDQQRWRELYPRPR